MNNNIEHVVLWCDKYKPQKTIDICGNKENIEIIKQWLTNFKNKVSGTDHALFISGPPGTGKTTIAHIVLSEMGYEVIEYNASDVRSQKSVRENLNKILDSMNVSMMQNSDKKNMGVIMDEVDGMSTGDRGGVSELASLINPEKRVKKKLTKKSMKKSKKNDSIVLVENDVENHDEQNVNDESETYINPIICICNNNSDKKLAELKKHCLEISFSKPSVKELLLFAKKIAKKEKMDIDLDALDFISEYAQGDFRRVGFILQDVNNTYDEKHITYDDVYKLKDVFLKKDMNITYSTTTNRILSTYEGIRTILELHGSDRDMISMNIHENFIRYLYYSGYDIGTYYRNIYYVHHYISLGDIIDKYTYNHHCNNLQSFNEIIKCAYPSYIINKNKIKKNKNSKVEQSPIDVNQLKFTTIKSKSASKKTNFSYVIQLKNSMKIDKTYLPHISDMVLKNVVQQPIEQHMFNDKKTQKEITKQQTLMLLNSYKMDVDDIDKITKIDISMIDNKKLLSTKLKTNITSIMKRFT